MNKNHKQNYIKNCQTSRERTLRTELIGEVSPAEKNFLDGCAYFIAGTLSKDDEKHTALVSQEMGRLVKRLIKKIKKDSGL